jgi:drug/metabolite transporter (DMT)-like permease
VFGVTGAVQQLATHRIESGRGPIGFVRGLLRQPLWLFSTLGSIAGFALQGLALSTGPLVLVQPLLVTGVLFAAVTAFLLRRGPVDPWLVEGLLMTAGGLALFLAVARPVPGDGVLTPGQVVPLAAGLAAVVAGCVAMALRVQDARRSLSLALAAGIVYGVTAAVAKVTFAQFPLGPIAVLTHWSLWVLVILGPTGFLLNQMAFHEAALVSPVVAVITVADPLVGIGIGLLWLGESVHAQGFAVVGEVAGLAIMAGGVWLVAQRTPHAPRDAGQPGSVPPVGEGTAEGSAEAGRYGDRDAAEA